MQVQVIMIVIWLLLRGWGHLITVVCLSLLATTASGQEQELQAVRDISIKGGRFVSLTGDRIVIVDADGQLLPMRIQTDPQKPISLGDGKFALQQPAKITVTGKVSAVVFEPGMTIELQTQIGNRGKTGPIASASILPMGTAASGIQLNAELPKGKSLAAAMISGYVESLNANQITMVVPKHDLAPKGKIKFDLSEFGEINLETISLAMVQAGDIVTTMSCVEISTGEVVVRKIEIELVGLREHLYLTADEKLTMKNIHLSDEPVAPRELRSKHFLLQTDLSDRQASILLEKLETMFTLLSDYYGRSTRDMIRCLVVDDLVRWDTSEFDPRGVAKIRIGEGICLYRRRGVVQQATVYAAANHAVVQHEAVHGFCFLTFGDTGPLWYAEGMAEMGQYWTPGERDVRADPVVIGYLTSAPLLSLGKVISAKQIQGDTWKAYAWRWALCHLLANNPNYSREFKKLGENMMTGGTATFETVFGPVADQISFEYRQFLQNLDAGLRVDLCSWNWNRRANRLGRTREAKEIVHAARGWQATGILVQRGQAYQVQADETWKMSPEGQPLDADGDDDGLGRLLGVILKDYQLSEVIELGTRAVFTAPVDGQLYLRCQEPLAKIADNDGQLKVIVRKQR